jgi:hypothetical protein
MHADVGQRSLTTHLQDGCSLIDQGITLTLEICQHPVIVLLEGRNLQEKQ